MIDTVEERRSMSRRVRHVLGDEERVNEFRAHGRFWDGYTVGTLLGRGNSSEVFRCVEKESGLEFAVKVMTVADSPPIKGGRRLSPGGAPTSTSADVLREVDVLASCVGVEGAIQLHQFFDDCHPDAMWPVVYIVLDLVRGVELVDVVAASHMTLREDQARGVLRQLLATLARLHDRQIVHRDIKHANIMLPAEDVYDRGVKLIDMGLALRLEDKDAAVTPCGTPIAIAPEILKSKTCGTPSDIWSCGILLYTLLSGFPPFYNKDIGELFQSIVLTTPSFSSPAWTNVSDDAIRLIRRCLNRDPDQRITAKEALIHPWIANTAGGKSPAQPMGQSMKRVHSHGSFLKA